MGYYSQFDYFIYEGTKVDLNRIKNLEEYFKNYNNDIDGFAEVEIIVNESELKGIELPDFYAKFYDDELFAVMLSECIMEGKVNLYFNGEDGDCWGYRVSPNKVEKISTVWVTDEEYEQIKGLKNLKDGYYIRFYDNENTYGLIQVPQTVDPEEIKVILEKFKSLDEYYDYYDFIEFLEKEGIPFIEIPHPDRVKAVDIYF